MKFTVVEIVAEDTTEKLDGSLHVLRVGVTLRDARGQAMMNFYSVADAPRVGDVFDIDINESLADPAT